MQQRGFAGWILAATLALSPLGARALEREDEAVAGDLDPWGTDFSFGDILFPHFHFIGVAGASSTDPAERALSAHDPQREPFDLLALEPALSLRLGDHLEGFVNHASSTDASGHLTGGVEEAFLKLTGLPGGLELRGGRFFNRAGFQNARHSHAWHFFDQHLAHARLLQEGELASIGGDLTWHLPVRYPTALTFSLGAPPSGHGHGHADAPPHVDESEGSGSGTEPHLDADDALFDDHVASVNLLASWHHNDFHQFLGTAHFTWGENRFGETTRVFGAGVEYLWRENGLEAGGRHWLWRTEALLRQIEARTGTHRGTEDEFGITMVISHGLTERLEASLRAEYVEGIDAFDLDERWRISPALTWALNAKRNVYLRLQYNHDQSDRSGEAHSIWCGLGMNWGGSEVR